MSRSWLKPGRAGCEMILHVQPGAARTELAGLHGDALKLRVAARAVEGAANAAVLAFVAEWLGLPRREVRLVRGEKSRRKALWTPLSAEELEARAAASL